MAVVTISLSTLSTPVKTTPSQVHNEKPSTVKIAVAEAEKPAEVSLQETTTEPVAEAVISEPAPAPIAHTVTGGKIDWLIAAGIPENEWQYVDYIVSRESGWNPCAYNPGMSDCNANPTSACGLAQSLPCGKQSVYGHWTDPVANLKWQYDYVRARYGGYAQAYAFWSANHWY